MFYILKRRLEIISFISGAVLMTIELVGSRLISPYLGTSTFIWTSIIGVILGFLSLGYWYGGRLSINNPSLSTLSKILFWAFVSVSAILFLQPLLTVLSFLPIDLRLLAVSASIILFGPMSFCLGMVSPYIARLKIESTGTSGSTVGTLYAISTLGSILGTFLGGFFLISFFGTSTIILFGALTIFILFIFASISDSLPKDRIVMSLLILFSLFFLPRSFVGGVADIDTLYNRWILGDYTNPQGEEIRFLRNNIIGTQSGIYKDNPKRLLFPYLKVFDIAPDINTFAKKDFRDVLLVGAGAYTYPMHFLSKYSRSHMDVVEIDAELVDIASRFFGFEPNSRISSYDLDARIFFKSNDKKYDIIFMDAFSSELSVPYHLTTVEAVTDLQKGLKSDGVVVVNVISAVTGDNARLFSSLWNTYSVVFPNLYALSKKESPLSGVQNIILIALNNREIFNEESIVSNMTEGWQLLNPEVFKTNIPILTDEFAPVEKYIGGFLKALQH